MKKILSLVLTLAMLASVCVFTGASVSATGTQWDGQAATSFAGGNGSKETPYKIGTAAELKLFANIVNGEDLTGTSFSQNDAACGILTADITLNNGTFTTDSYGNPLYNGKAVDESVNAWFPIGYSYDIDGDGYRDRVSYTGSFNGAGHTVSGVYFNNAEHWYAGLFGYISFGAEISNLGVVNSYFSVTDAVGGVCGYNYYGTITNCYNTGTVSGGSSYCYTGGVCGSNEKGTITDCYNTGAVSGVTYTGGVCGYSTSATSGCYNTGAVSGTKNIGGVCGYSKGAISGCYNTGAVSGTENVGGVCGSINWATTPPTITGCYNIGLVSGTTNVGGVCGMKYNPDTPTVGQKPGIITNCYYLQGTAAVGIGNQAPGSAEAKTEAQMKMQDFTSLLNENGGKFVFYGGYPAQKWEKDPSKYSTTLTYTVASDYIVTIPGEVTLDSEFTVSAEKVVLEQGKQLQIALTATSDPENEFKVTNGGKGELTYGITNGGNPVEIGNTVLTVNPATSASGETTLNFSKPNETPQFAGTYTGTVTFTVSVKKAPINVTLAPEQTSAETVTLTAEPGMTWREWIASEYNTDNWVIDDYKGILTDTNDDENTKWLGITTGSYDGVWYISAAAIADDVIAAGTIYTLVRGE